VETTLGRARCALRAVCAASILIGLSLPAVAAEGPLAGEMAAFNHLVGGTWICAITVPALRGRSAEAIYYSVTYDVAPGNKVHARVLSGNIVGDQYYGYDAKSKRYWQAALNSEGKYSWATSPNGITYSTYTFDSDPIDAKGDILDFYANLNTSTRTSRVLSTPGNQVALTGVCTRPVEAIEPAPKN
jgi:hypothetical protein